MLAKKDCDQTQAQDIRNKQTEKCNLRYRLLVSLFGIPVIGLLLFWPTAFHLLLVLCAAIMAWEWGMATHPPCSSMPRSALQEQGFGFPSLWPFSLPAQLLIGLSGLFVLFPLLGLPYEAVLLSVCLTCFLLYSLANRMRIPNPLWLSLGLLSVIPCLAIAWMIHSVAQGSLLIAFLFSITWATDSAAFFVGRWLGGPRLAHRLSPKKTWSGFLGGLLAAFVGGVCWHYGLVWTDGHTGLLTPTTNHIPSPLAQILTLSPFVLGLIAGGIGLLSPGGDLLESGWKRRFGLKNSSNLIPGHGGIWDRVDSFLLTAPLGAIIFYVYAA